MKNKLILACVVTQTHLKEFLLLKFSAEQYHECEWYIACDEYSYDYLQSFSNCRCIKYNIKNGRVFGTKEESENFLQTIMCKFSIAKKALETNSYVLLVDTDIIFTNQTDATFKEFVSKDIDVAVSPHYQWNNAMDADWGRYNVGFNFLKSVKFIDAWENLTKQRIYKFEQVPMAKLIQSKEFIYDEFPINYNMGWWRFNNQFSQYRYMSFYLREGNIIYDGLPVVSFHMHSFISDPHSEGFRQNIFAFLSNSSLYSPLLEKYQELKVLNL